MVYMVYIVYIWKIPSAKVLKEILKWLQRKFKN